MSSPSLTGGGDDITKNSKNPSLRGSKATEAISFKIAVIASEAKQYLGILNLFLGILEFDLGILEFALGILDFCSLLG